jgi:hypothetical protein
MTTPVKQPSFVERARKFLVGAVGLAAQVLASGVLDGDAQLWVQAAIAVAFAAGIYQVPNAPTVERRTSP